MQSIQAVDARDTILIAVRTGKLDDSEFYVHLMRGCGCALLSVIIVHDEAGVNDSWNPAKQRQNQAEKETGNTTGHEHSQRRKNHAEKIPQRFHLFVFLLAFVFLFL